MTQSDGGELLLGWHFDMINGKLLQNEPGSGEFSAAATRQSVGKSNQHSSWKVPA
jgi:hypothetical protein